MIINFKSYSDSRGTLTVIEKDVPFLIKRIYYIYDVDNSKRGFHKHKKTRQLAVCIKGSCEILIKNFGGKTSLTKLDSPKFGKLIEPEDYHWMQNFTKDAVLLILASEFYDENDYIRYDL